VIVWQDVSLAEEGISLMAMIETQGLAKTFKTRKGTVEAVRGVDLSIDDGEIFGFLGPNGAGKTTTMRMLATLLPPTSGQAKICGYDLLREAGQVRTQIGYVGQKGGAEPTETGRENLVLQGRLYGMSKADAQKRAAELIGTLDLEPFADRLVRTYSGGQRRRLDMAMGLMHQPRLLFLDEPTTGLDPQSRALHGLQLYVERGEEVLPDVLRLLDHQGAAIRTVTLARPTLDDVFLRLTGRSLREPAESI
jgi:ABC-type multidrug transport system ATPase subunit